MNINPRIDPEVMKVLEFIRQLLLERDCSNPSISNVLCTLLGAPHINCSCTEKFKYGAKSKRVGFYQDAGIGALAERNYLDDMISTLRHDLREYGILPSCLVNFHRLVVAEKKVEEMRNEVTKVKVLEFTVNELKMKQDDLIEQLRKDIGQMQIYTETIQALEVKNKELDELVKKLQDNMRGETDDGAVISVPDAL